MRVNLAALSHMNSSQVRACREFSRPNWFLPNGQLINEMVFYIIAMASCFFPFYMYHFIIVINPVRSPNTQSNHVTRTSVPEIAAPFQRPPINKIYERHFLSSASISCPLFTISSPLLSILITALPARPELAFTTLFRKKIMVVARVLCVYVYVCVCVLAFPRKVDVRNTEKKPDTNS